METISQNTIQYDDVISKGKKMFQYLWTKKLLIILISFIGGIIGIVNVWLQDPAYSAELTFTPENSSESKIGAYAGIAAQFGIDLGIGGGGVFEGDNIIELFKSNILIEETLESPIGIKGYNSLIDYYIPLTKNKKIIKLVKDNKIVFTNANQKGNRIRDSIMKVAIKDIGEKLDVDKIDKKLTIIKVSFLFKDEIFAKKFVEALTNTAVNYYLNYKSEKARQNVAVLQHQADSVKAELFGSVTNVAELNDLNVNPTRQAARVGSQKRSIDVQVNGAIYTEILKNLELAKIALRRETPFIQIIDRPIYPLKNKKMGRLKGGILGAFIFGFLTVLILTIKKSFINSSSKETQSITTA